MHHKSPKEITIADFSYKLPDEKIALFPLKERDQSKLLVYKNGIIEEAIVENITDFIPQNSILVFNNSKVINARIRFQKSTGSKIEVFCLEPAEENNEYSSVMKKTKSVRWKCFIGGASKWKDPFIEKNISVSNNNINLKAQIIKVLSEGFIVEFSWTPEEFCFAEIVEVAGEIPLPPYIKRLTENNDAARYQTIYAKIDGSVAAPTAGLHFSKKTFNQLTEKKIKIVDVTLHVGAGTFKPVQADMMADHEMHAEWIDVDVDSIQKLIDNKDKIIAVGTTSLRTIESLYWLGVKSKINPTSKQLNIEQWEVYNNELSNSTYSVEESLHSLIDWIKKNNRNNIVTQTKLLITPGYQFKITKAIITNFHQPQSTLLLLIAAAIGEEWRKCYDYALSNNFRFLCYGDTSLLFMAEW